MPPFLVTHLLNALDVGALADESDGATATARAYIAAAAAAGGGPPLLGRGPWRAVLLGMRRYWWDRLQFGPGPSLFSIDPFGLASGFRCASAHHDVLLREPLNSGWLRTTATGVSNLARDQRLRAGQRSAAIVDALFSTSPAALESVTLPADLWTHAGRCDAPAGHGSWMENGCMHHWGWRPVELQGPNDFRLEETVHHWPTANGTTRGRRRRFSSTHLVTPLDFFDGFSMGMQDLRDFTRAGSATWAAVVLGSVTKHLPQVSSFDSSPKLLEELLLEPGALEVSMGLEDEFIEKGLKPMLRNGMAHPHAAISFFSFLATASRCILSGPTRLLRLGQHGTGTRGGGSSGGGGGGAGTDRAAALLRTANFDAALKAASSVTQSDNGLDGISLVHGDRARALEHCAEFGPADASGDACHLLVSFHHLAQQGAFDSTDAMFRAKLFGVREAWHSYQRPSLRRLLENDGTRAAMLNCAVCNIKRNHDDECPNPGWHALEAYPIYRRNDKLYMYNAETGVFVGDLKESVGLNASHFHANPFFWSIFGDESVHATVHDEYQTYVKHTGDGIGEYRFVPATGAVQRRFGNGALGLELELEPDQPNEQKWFVLCAFLFTCVRVRVDTPCGRKDRLRWPRLVFFFFVAAQLLLVNVV